MIHPWRRFRDLAHFKLRWHEGGDLGFTDFESQTVSLRRGLNQAGRRSTILHECLHVERGPVPEGLAAREELRVRKLAAQMLLPDIRAIADALAWAEGDLEAAADELWVDVPTLRDRLRFISHPAERAYLQARLEEISDHHGHDQDGEATA
ncbi:hypothetical protein [Nocardioides bruguierae]|uniref:hypothetical protein n=1 Tax=Nocardioides bruguierae TaxID=2945102 RepID=UPI0020203921|nr:hypothetical protein [Nocardioides bruguierae]MCL8026353.1 hypothetical protein [Nocardioides bruguierae]